MALLESVKRELNGVVSASTLRSSAADVVLRAALGSGDTALRKQESGVRGCFLNHNTSLLFDQLNHDLAR